MLAKQPQQIVGATLKKASALERQPVVKQEHATDLNQAPETIFGTVIGCQHERVVGDTELENLRQARMGFRFQGV